jgi:hypothetical protein
MNSGVANGLDWEVAPGAVASDQSYQISNLGLSSIVASNILSTSVFTKSGAVPTAGNPVYIGFRSTAANVGLYNQRSITGSLSVSTVATGASFGTTSNISQPIYVYAIDNAGTVELGLAGSETFDEGTLQSTTAMSSGSTGSSVIYTASARTNVPVRLIGRLKVTEATAGTYATAPSEISVMPTNDNTKPKDTVMVTTLAGHGSSNTKITRYTGVYFNIGNAITWVDSSTNGSMFTINKGGTYVINSCFISDAGTISGFSRNSSQLTTDIYAITGSDALGYADETAGAVQCVGWSGVLQPGDVIRPHDRGGANTTNTDRGRFSITKVSD